MNNNHAAEAAHTSEVEASNAILARDNPQQGEPPATQPDTNVQSQASVLQTAESSKPSPIIKELQKALQETAPKTHIDLDEQLLKELAEPYYYDNLTYVCRTQENKYIPLSSGDARSRIDVAIVQRGIDDKDMRKAITKQAIAYIQDHHCIAATAEIAGFPKGFYTTPDDVNILVTKEAKLLEPRAGSIDKISDLIDQLFGEFQRGFILGYLSVFARHLYDIRNGKKKPWDRQPLPAIVLVGPVECGKTLFVKLMAEAFGGRVADPFKHLTQTSNFNGELCKAEFQIMDDSTALRDNSTRSKLSTGLKQWLFASSVRIEAKYKHPVNVPVHSIVFSALNNTLQSLMCLPVLDDSLKDKISYFLVSARPGGFPTDNEEKERMISDMRAELPSLMHYLLHVHEIPETLKHSRTGVRTFHNPEVLEMMNDISPEEELLAILIDSFKVTLRNTIRKDRDHRVRVWSGRSNALLRYLEESKSTTLHRLRQLFPNTQNLGIRLYELHKQHPDMIRLGPINKGTRTYQFYISEADVLEFYPEFAPMFSTAVRDELARLDQEIAADLAETTTPQVDGEDDAKQERQDAA